MTAPIGVYISEIEIKNRIHELAIQINNDYKDQELILVCILNGSFIFCADLMREIKGNVQVEFISVSSYHGAKSTGDIQFRLDVKQSLVGKNILIVEDIVDTGLTLTFLLEHLRTKRPNSLKLCSLLLKKARLKIPVHVDYLGFDIEDKFVIGYGLDYDGRYRELPYIGVYGES